MAGWIKLHRSILDKGYYKDSEVIHLWCHLLIMASHKTRETMFNGHLIKLEAGQLITGRLKLSEQTGISQTSIRRILKLLEINHQIDQQKTSGGTCISICNWHKYQEADQPIDQPLTNDRPTTDQRPTTIQEGGEVKKGKKGKKDIVVFIPPLLEDVIKHFKENGFSEDLAKRAFKHYNDYNWIDSKGNKVKEWKRKMNSVWLKEENKNASQPAYPQPATRIRTPYVAND